MQRYCGVLNTEENDRFQKDFSSLDVSNGTKVHIKTREGCRFFTVTLIPEDGGADQLDASFSNGLLRNWGWNKKFKKIQ